MRVYDIFTNTFVDDEERKRREEEAKRMGETEVGKTEVTQYADGSQTRTTTQEIPSQQTVMRPGQEGQFMRPVMPIAPNQDQMFQRLLQAESGTRQFTPQGQVITSPKGAMGIGQVMPATAMNPGFGLPSIFDLAQSKGIEVANRDEATAKQLLGNQELNTEFARNYMNAMVQRKGPEAGIAAYNAGPGRVQQAMSQAQQTGQPLQQFLPQETQQFVQRVLGPTQPTTQQAMRVNQPISPTQPTQQLVGQGLRIPGVPPSPAPTEESLVQNKITEYQTIGDNIDGLLKYGLSENTPEYLQVRAKNRAAELLNENRNLEKAKSEVAQMDETALSKVLREKTTGGNWAKYVAFNLLGMETLALDEAAKLGIGREVPTTINGKPALIKMAANGLPLEGYDATTGNKLDSKELLLAADNLRNIKGAQQSSETYADPTGKVKGNFVLERREGGGAPVFKEVGTGRVATPMESQVLQKLGVSGGLDYQRQQQVQRKNIDLQADWEKGRIQAIQAGPIAANKWLGEFNAKHGTQFVPQQITGGAPQIDSVTGKLTQQPTGVGVAQQQAQGATTATQAVAQTNETPAQIERRNKLAETRSEGLAKFYDETLTKESASGDKVSGVRKQQLALFDNPKVNMANIFGIATGAGRPPGDQQWTIVRDILSGKFAKDTEGQAINPQQLSQRLAQLGLNADEVNVIYQYDILNRQLLGETLRDTAGAGSVSNIEQQMNRDRQVDITRAPALGAYNLIFQTKFDADRMRYKSDWAADKEFKSIAEFNKEWRKESKRINDLYMDQTKARLDFIQKQPGGAENVNAIREAYRRFPVPEYDPNSGWKKTKPLSEILR